MENTSQKSKLRTQIEYYLSDENLQNDVFFHAAISKNKDGYMDMNSFLKCKKIKELGVNQLSLVKEACEDSPLLEVKEDTVRRLANKALPELSLIGKKRESSLKGNSNDNQGEPGKEKQDSIILEISTPKVTEIKWSVIKDTFKSNNTDLDVVYMRFKDNAGHIGIFAKKGTTLNFTKNLEVEKTKFTIKQCEGDELIEFWSRHGVHFDMITGKDDKKPDGSRSSSRKKKSDPKALKKEVTLGGEMSLTNLDITTWIR